MEPERPVTDQRLALEAGMLLGRALTPVRRLGGGQHAVTVLTVDEAGTQYVVRMFPPGDAAPAREVEVSARLEALGDLVPVLVEHDLDRVRPVLVTLYLPGAPPAPSLPLELLAAEMARALARIHTQKAETLRKAPGAPPAGNSDLADRARSEWVSLDTSELVLTHYDFWSGNTLWVGDTLTGVVDWSGARQAPRGVDIAWCRQDLVLLGSVEAADVFLAEYERQTQHVCRDVAAWDLQAAALAATSVEGWVENYSGVGRPHITRQVLRQRFDQWINLL